MKKLFDFLNDIHYKKPIGYKISADDDFSPYMTQRFISMASPAHCAIINELYNTKYKGFEDAQMMYDYLMVNIPKRNINRVEYIKKQNTASADSERTTMIQAWADLYQMSKREIEPLVDMFPEESKKILRESEIIRRKRER